MTPERWRQVTAIFHAARQREPDRRPALLDQMCGPDVSLRAEVESLLAAQAQAGKSSDASLALDLLPQLSPGTSFGAYRVDALVGAGGMGQVYRATDMRLRRTVAIKVLPPGLSDDPDFDARFEREARLLASLSHPNIGAIYGLEDAGGVHGLVLEFIEGPTLAERLAQGQLSFAESAAIAKQIALALEAAHEKGIIHRDLKPANIKLAPDGVVKVLDFGIARVVDTGASVPTVAMDTGTGIVMGTPAYMSPEQARGLVVDKRTDIWAFGCVFFEMLSGFGPFAGDTASDSLARVIEREPDWSALPADLAPPIRRLLERCLRKSAPDRLHDIADARIEIAEAIATPAPAVSIHPSTTVIRRVPAALVLGALVLVAIGGWLIWRAIFSTAVPPATPARMEFGITFPSSFIPAQGVAVSPDGQYLAAGVFTNSPQIWIHSFQTSETRPLPGGEGGAFPFWSPDGTRLAFFRAGGLISLDMRGGAGTSIAENASGGTGGTWNSAGVILYTAQGKLFRVPAAGGAPVELPLTNPAGLPFAPCFLPDDRHFIFFAVRPVGGTVQLGTLDSAEVTPLAETDRPPTFIPPDRLVFVRNATIFSQRFDMSRLVLAGQPEVVASGATSGVIGRLTTFMVSGSTNGILAFPTPRGGSSGRLTWVSRDGKPGESIESPPGDAEYLNPVISPDGKFVAANLINPQTGDSDIWLVDTVRNVPSKLTTDHASESDPVWSPDGKEIAYLSDRGGRYALYVQAAAGGAPREVLDLSNVRIASPTDWSRDGRYILYQQLDGGQWAAWALPLFGDRKPFLMTGDQTTGYGGHLSPDGRWLAYAAFESDQFEIFVRRFPEGSPKKQISHGGGVHPRWTRDGKELVYWAPPRGIFANDITIAGSEITVGPTRTLVDRPVLSLIDGRPHYDITHDGERLLVRQPLGPPRPGIRVLLNWMSKGAR